MQRRQEAAGIFAGCTAGRMGVAEANESPRPAEPELALQRNGVWLAAERTSRLATRKEVEAEGTAGMDDRRNDGRGARMASSNDAKRNPLKSRAEQFWAGSLLSPLLSPSCV
jgi:hypothetical protein